MTDRYEGVRQKVGRAKEHIDHLETVVSAFHESRPYRLVPDFTIEPPDWVHIRVHFDKPLPASVPLIIGDAVHNLRSALDHFAHCAVPSPTTDTAFPVMRKGPTPTTAALKGHVKGKLKGTSLALQQAVCALQPYEGGDGHWLWALDQLDVIDKHRLLITMFHEYAVNLADITRGTPAENPFPDPEINAQMLSLMETLVLTASDGAIDGEPVSRVHRSAFEKDTGVTVRFQVTLEEPESLRHTAVVPALRGLVHQVESLLVRLIPLV
ncbi:MAG TPA: hypothetical protein VHD58_01095 [Mycobacteriales bacterium]|nr:hypothetical protein [Mycobacteriales bacterium]